MSQLPGSALSPPDFLAEVGSLLTPMYAECFTDETRKVRDLLLVTSIVLILFDFRVIEINQEMTLPLLSLTIRVTTGTRAILILLCLYFIVSLIMRSYTEWKLWRLLHQAPMMKLLDLLAKVESSWQARTTEANTTLNSSIRVLKRLTKLNLELMQVEDQGSKERSVRKPQLELERKELKRQITEMKNVHRNQIAEPEIKLLEAQIFYLCDAVRPAGRTLRNRFWWEMIFPIGFGVLALISGFVVHKVG
jgi:hypothetical protein